MPRLARMALAMLIVLVLTTGSASAWWLAEGGPGERSLVIGHTNECGRTTWHHAETPQTVVVWESVERGTGVCPAILILEQTVIPLSHALGGRHVEGGSEASPLRPMCRKYKVNGVCPTPRLTGLSPPDASFLLRGRQRRASFRVIGRTSGLARVISQSPAPGADLPARSLHVSILAHR